MGRFVDLGDVCGDASIVTHPTPDGAPLSRGESACTLNADGSYDIEMTIEFFPQRWFYLGLLISGTTLAGCVGYLGWEFVRRRKRKED